MLNALNTSDALDICFRGSICLWLVFAIRYIYFAFKYDWYLQEKLPERAKDLKIFKWGTIYQAMGKLSKASALGDAELHRLAKKVRNSFYYALFCMLAAFCSGPWIFD